MPCYTGITDKDMQQHFEILLCKACKFLTVDQIKSLTNNNSGIQDGLTWYANHLWLDCMHNDNDPFGFSDGPSEKELALKELHRIGLDIKQNENGSELIPFKSVYPY